MAFLNVLTRGPLYYDAYVVTDSIKKETRNLGLSPATVITCDVKEVFHGKVINTRRWRFDNSFGHWRYIAPPMHGHTSIVMWNGWSGKILETCFDYT